MTLAELVSWGATLDARDGELTSPALMKLVEGGRDASRQAALALLQALSKANVLVGRSRWRASDIVYDAVDALVLAGDMHALNGALADAFAAKPWHPHVVYALLSATAPIGAELPQRQPFYRWARRHMAANDSMSPGDLDRLAPENWTAPLPEFSTPAARVAFAKLLRANALPASEVRAAGDMIFDALDDLMMVGRHDQADEVLRKLSAPTFSTDMIFAILGVTAPYAEELAARTPFYAQARAEVERRGDGDLDYLTRLAK